MQNSKKIRNNVILGIISQLLTIVLGIVVPRLVLVSYGSEVNGLINSVTQIYSYVALLEAGVGNATVQALYKTLGTKDIGQTNSILAATNRYYHRTGSLYFLAIVFFSIVYPLAIDSDIPRITVILIIVCNGLGNVINFFFQGKYMLLLRAEGKNYIKTSLDMCTNVFKNIAKIVLISYGFDVVWVQALAMVISLIQMIYITWYINKEYRWINLNVEPDFESISQSKNVLVHEISGLIFNNTDTIILTFFCGLKTVSVYSMYTMLFSMIGTALNIVSGSVTFVLGQTFHANRKKFLEMQDGFELYFMTFVFALYSIANFFILPFMKCYTAGVNDINYIDDKLPLLIIVIKLLMAGRISSSQVIGFAGHFKQTQNRSIIESVINLLVSLIAVYFWGIYGVLVGTIVALLYRTNDMIFYASHRILHRSVWKTYKRWGINIVVFCVVIVMNQFFKGNLNTYKDIIMYCFPYSIAVCFIFFVVATISEPKTVKFVISFLENKIKND